MMTLKHNATNTDVPMLRVRLPNAQTVFGSAASKADIRYLYSEIFENKCYERNGISIQDRAVVIDVGANIGLFALRVTDLAPNARVYCFEPVPPTYACLTKNVSQRAGVVTFNAALMATPRPFDVTFYPYSPGNSTLFPEKKSREMAQIAQQWTLRRMWQLSKLGGILMGLTYPLARQLQRFALGRILRDAQTYRIQSMTLDQVFQEQHLTSVDLLKCDVEGAEQDVFEGLSDANIRCVRQLVVEISPDKKEWIAAFEDRLRGAGFDHIVLASSLPGGEPRTDVFPCNLYATRRDAAREPADNVARSQTEVDRSSFTTQV